jgi:hypothetical protein
MTVDGEITIRVLGTEETGEVARLAQLDSAEPLSGRLLGASVGGRMVAALSLDSGDSVASPFDRSGYARAMLELRARQLNGKDRRSFLRRRSHARAALPASPPGAGGRLLALARQAGNRS